jgi:prolyl-tRNA editing enzyme YbaK/EbsC (Cys-tRNA(Pro) deacylase)
MSKATGRFTQAAAEFDVAVEVQHFPDGTRTAADAASAVGCDVGQIVKSLVFVVDDRPVLALTSGSNRVDPVRLAAVAGGADARPATADEARAATGFAIGGTPPFGHGEKLATYLDPDLTRYETVWAAAGTPDTCFALAPAELARAADAMTASFTEASR